jgi:hypothetical protein
MTTTFLLGVGCGAAAILFRQWWIEGSRVDPYAFREPRQSD